MVYIWPGATIDASNRSGVRGRRVGRPYDILGANVNMSVVAVLTATGRLSSTVLFDGSKLTMV